MVDEVAPDVREERLGADRGVVQTVDGVRGWFGEQVAVVVIDGDGSTGVDRLGEREDHRFVLRVVHEVGLRLVVAQTHPSHDRRRQHGPARVTPDRTQPRRRHVHPPHRHPVGHLRHHRRRVGATERGSCHRVPQTLAMTGRARCCGDRAASSGGDAPGSSTDAAVTRRFDGRIRHCDLVSRQRSAEVAHRPSGGEDLGFVLAGAAEDELALGEPRDRVADGGDVDPAARRAHPVEEALLVAVGLQPSDHPRAGVGQCLVVDVDRVLGRQHDPDAECTRLLHQQHDRLLGGRVGGGRQVSGDLVHVEQHPQIGGAALVTHPRDDLRQHQ